MVSALFLLGAVGFTLMAAYQWMSAKGDRRVRAWSTGLAVIFWLIWFFEITTHA
jgi:hypothetical protein